MSHILTVGSLFAGIGGFERGLEQTGGFHVAWQIEKELFCQEVLTLHWPHTPRYGDIRDCGEGRTHTLTSVDVLCGGFPCQPHSVSGKRKASTDERDLWGEFSRLISEIRPQWVLAENVPGLLSSEDGQFFGGILRDLAKAGYDAEWYSLRASDVGAPHQRERVFLVAYPYGTRLEVRDRSQSQEGACNPPFVEGQRQVEPRLGRILNELPQRLDEYQWPARPGKPQYPWEPSRTLTGRVTAAQKAALKALGNAIVPQCVMRLAYAILQYEKEHTTWITHGTEQQPSQR